MFYAARQDDKLAGLDPFMMVAEVHSETSFDYEAHFIFLFVMMEHELRFEFIELHILAVEFGGDVGLPVFGNRREFLGDVHLGHGKRRTDGGREYKYDQS